MYTKTGIKYIKANIPKVMLMLFLIAGSKKIAKITSEITIKQQSTARQKVAKSIYFPPKPIKLYPHYITLYPHCQ